jgi:hypothetical protein
LLETKSLSKVADQIWLLPPKLSELIYKIYIMIGEETWANPSKVASWGISYFVFFAVRSKEGKGG